MTAGAGRAGRVRACAGAFQNVYRHLAVGRPRARMRRSCRFLPRLIAHGIGRVRACVGRRFPAWGVLPAVERTWRMISSMAATRFLRSTRRWYQPAVREIRRRAEAAPGYSSYRRTVPKAVREIRRRAEAAGYRFSALVSAVVESVPFRLRRAPEP